MYSFDMFNDIAPQKHVSITKRRGPNYLGPFKGQGPYHCQRKCVEFLLIQSSNLIELRLLLQKLRKRFHTFGTTCIQPVYNQYIYYHMKIVPYPIDVKLTTNSRNVK